jgi:hypothetical protein
MKRYRTDLSNFLYETFEDCTYGRKVSYTILPVNELFTILESKGWCHHILARCQTGWLYCGEHTLKSWEVKES